MGRKNKAFFATNLIKLKNKPSFLIKIFLLSKRALKPVYGLNTTSIVILRYIADAIEMSNKRSNKNISSTLYFSQIAKYCFCAEKTVQRHIKVLIKKRMLVHHVDNHMFSLGKVFIAVDLKSSALDGGLKVQSTRRGTLSPPSKFSNLTNPIGYADIEKQSTAFKRQENPRKLTADEKTKGSENMKHIKNLLNNPAIGGKH